MVLTLSEGRTLRGELLAVEDSTLLLAVEGSLHRVPLRAVVRGAAPRLGFTDRLEPGTRERLRLISRYPQGVSPDLERRLLQAYGREAVTPAP